MPLLSASFSQGLEKLLHSSPPPVDAIEVTPWLPLAEFRKIKARLPEATFYFHGSNLLGRLQWIQNTRPTYDSFMQLTGSPWLSIHITTLPFGYVWLAQHGKLYLPFPNPQKATDQFIRSVQALKQNLPYPLVLENMPPLAHPAHSYWVEPDRLGRIIRETGCPMLLDLPHARLASLRLQMPVETYLQRLPLDQVVEIHVSGIRSRKNEWFDAHEPAEEEDYSLLQWTLAHTNPRIVNLEYFRDGTALQHQLARLRTIIPPAAAG